MTTSVLEYPILKFTSLPTDSRKLNFLIILGFFVRLFLGVKKDSFVTSPEFTFVAFHAILAVAVVASSFRIVRNHLMYLEKI